jgi:carbon storage regulator
MLVLSRKLGEKIIIDGQIAITVVRIDRNQIRLGIEAPRSVSVVREELRDDPDHAPVTRQAPLAAHLVS